jgi:archaellum component FlaD/FlaE
MKKITEADLVGKGVVGQEDTPMLSASEMQYKVEEITRDVVIPAVNTLVDEVEDRYTRKETDTAINEKVKEIGAGDMAKAVYDADGDDVVDNAMQLDGHPASYFAKATDFSALTTDIKAIRVVDSLPEIPDMFTLYLIPKK